MLEPRRTDVPPKDGRIARCAAIGTPLPSASEKLALITPQRLSTPPALPVVTWQRSSAFAYSIAVVESLARSLSHAAFSVAAAPEQSSSIASPG
jgi:hypothetical protein